MKEQKLKELLEKMTLSEKIAQMVQIQGRLLNAGSEEAVTGPLGELNIDPAMLDNIGSVLNAEGAENLKRLQSEYAKRSAHGIPLLFMLDIINGYKTIFPIPLAQGCSWSPELLSAAAGAAAREAASSGLHVNFSPMVDVVRDARWGRVMETAGGEDPFLGELYAEAVVRGYQRGLSDTEGAMAACVKHFAGYGAAEAGREYNTVDITERRLRNEYLPPYKAAVDAGCEMVMTAFNIVDGIPMSANTHLMRDVLRGEWGFDGVVVSDYAAVRELIPHGAAENDADAAKKALLAGVDIDMGTNIYANNLESLVLGGEVPESLIDEAVLRILHLKNKLGLFESPFRGASEEQELKLHRCVEHLSLARETAARSCVLLKNDAGVLPLKPGTKIALIGPYANSELLCGMWSHVLGAPQGTVTLERGLLERLPDESLSSAPGCDILEECEQVPSAFQYKYPAPLSKPEEQWQKALDTAKQADVVVLALGEHCMQTGEGASRTDPRLPQKQRKLAREIAALGKKTVVVVFCGRPLDLSELSAEVDSLLIAWFPGTEGGHAVADILLGERSPVGRLNMSFPRAAGQCPVYYNHYSTGRPRQEKNRFTTGYSDCENEPLYPFGFGLSYTNFKYGGLILDKNVLTPNSTITLRVVVENVGERPGEETVQLYIRDICGSVVRPVKELRAFERVELQAGEKKVISFSITEQMLKFWTADMVFCAEPGRFEAMAGPNSENLLIEAFEYREE